MLLSVLSCEYAGFLEELSSVIGSGHVMWHPLANSKSLFPQKSCIFILQNRQMPRVRLMFSDVLMWVSQILVVMRTPHMLDIYDAGPSQHPHPGLLSAANINILSLIIMNWGRQSEDSHLWGRVITTNVGTNFEDYIISKCYNSSEGQIAMLEGSSVFLRYWTVSAALREGGIFFWSLITFPSVTENI